MTLPPQPASAVELESDPASKQDHDELVEAHALPLSLSDEAGVEAGGHSDEDFAARVHGANSSAYAIDMASSACDTACMSKRTPSQHRRGTVSVLGYDRAICVECGTTWPCVDSVKETCERLDLANGLPCNCGWHEEDDQ